MIVIFASSCDTDASALMKRWTVHNASLLTCNDLSLAGWRYYLSSPALSTAVVSAKEVPVEEIRGVLIRWPGVFPQELPHIVEADRNYVAQEMTAFLVAWLSSLECTVINRPTPLNLAGPAWRHEQWTKAAIALDIAVRPSCRHVAFGFHDKDSNSIRRSSSTVTVVGQESFGDVDHSLKRQAQQLAMAAGVSLLKVHFSGPERGAFFTGAELIPELNEEVADAVLNLLLLDRQAINHLRKYHDLTLGPRRRSRSASSSQSA